MKYFLIALINLYQKTLSPDHGWFKGLYPYGFCKYHPSCSEYAKQAVEKHGAILGLYYAGKRLLSCNPWSRGGIDLVK
jgi:putative membrane protein insertion efficiency factor